ncbi:MAG: penicillin-binding transpeptidase domain-containing protein [Tepidiformaceae bacterium]
MRGVFVVAVVVGLLIGSVVGGVRAFTSRSSSPPAAPGATAEPGSPGATASQWAAAWSAGDVTALHAMLSLPSQAAITRDRLDAAYADFAHETTQERLRVTVTSASPEQATLSVHLGTAYFGNLEYTITLPFTREVGSFAVNWSEAVMHPRMAGGNRFRSEIQVPRRGAIVDRNGEALAITRDVRLLGLNRAVINDRAAITANLVEFGFTREQVDAAFDHRAGIDQRVTVGDVRDAEAEAAVALIRTPGILLFFEEQRVHPLGGAAAHVVGYTRELTAEELAARAGEGFRIGDRVGAIGLERTQEAVLAGKVGAELRIVDPGGATLQRLISREYVAGADVRTTLDARVLTAAAARLGARGGAAVVIDPVTNALLALNSSPSFDPDAFERNDAAALAVIAAAPGGPQSNRATGGLYSAGSTFKLITGAAGLSSGLFTVTDQLNCSATWTGLDPPRRNWEGSQGLLTIAEGLMRSCNPVFYEIALRLYNETDGTLSSVARAFGFGAETGVQGLGEEAGLVPDAAWKRTNRNEAWFPGDEVNLGIGQGDLLITPLQLANAYSSFLAGVLRAPVVLASAAPTPRGDLSLTAAQSAHLRRGLELVTSARGTASAAFANAGYSSFGGKSGTAEDAGEQQHVLFVAYAPAASPRAIAAVVLDDGESGSVEAGPIARDIVLAALP